MKFTNIKVYRKALKEWAIKRGYEYTFLKNSSKRIIVIYKEKCRFRIHASKMQMSTTFQIKAFQPQHTYPRDSSSKLVDSTYLANKYLDDLRDNPKWDVLAIQKKF